MLIFTTGYLAIHLLGLSAGTVLLPPSPSFFRRMQHVLQNPNASLTDDHASRSGSESDDDTPGRKRARVGYRRENDKTATELCSYAVVWWVTLGAIRLLGTGGGISRRVVRILAHLAPYPRRSPLRRLICRISSGSPPSTLPSCLPTCCSIWCSFRHHFQSLFTLQRRN